MHCGILTQNNYPRVVLLVCVLIELIKVLLFTLFCRHFISVVIVYFNHVVTGSIPLVGALVFSVAISSAFLEEANQLFPWKVTWCFQYTSQSHVLDHVARSVCCLLPTCHILVKSI